MTGIITDLLCVKFENLRANTQVPGRRSVSSLRVNQT